MRVATTDFIYFSPRRAKIIEKELQMMKPGLKLVKDEEVKPVTQDKEEKSQSDKEEPLTPTQIQAALPYGHVASWLWDFFNKKGDKKAPEKRVSQLGQYYTKI